MVVSSRAIVALGLGVVGLVCLIGPSAAQGPQDSSARKASNTGTAAPATPKANVPAVIGTIDIEAVLKAYDKVKAQQEEFASAAKAKQSELVKLQTEGQEGAAMLRKMTPNSVDAKKIEGRLTEIKAQLQAAQENAQREFELRESEMLATLYKEVQAMVGAIANHKGLTYVVRVSNEPVSGSNPNSVLAAMGMTFVYADPRNDITKDVIHNLNLRYKAAGGTTPKAASGAGAGAPSGN